MARRRRTLTRTLLTLLSTATVACVSSPSGREGAPQNKALIAPVASGNLAAASELQTHLTSGVVGLSLTVQRPSPTQSSFLDVVFRNAEGTEQAFTHAFAETTLPSQATALVFPLAPGLWTLEKTVLGIGNSRVPFSLLTPSEGLLTFESKKGGLLHLGELKIAMSAPQSAESNAHTDVRTTYLPFTPPRASVWKAFLEALESLALERLASDPDNSTDSETDTDTDSESKKSLRVVQVSTPLLFEEGEDAEKKAFDLQSRYVGLLSNAPGYAFFESETGRVTRVKSTPVGGLPDLHIFTHQVLDAKHIAFKGGCLPLDAARFLPDCPLATLLPDLSAPRTVEPLLQGTFRYLGFLDVVASTKTFSLRHEWPEAVRVPVAAWLGKVVPTSFVLGERLRTKPPGSWDFVDANGATLQGIPPGEKSLFERLQSDIHACAQDLWRADPLAPTEFLLWIQPPSDGKISVSAARSHGFAGPGLRHLEACLASKAAALDASKISPLSAFSPPSPPSHFGQGIGARFH
ncbi:MAG: hypothetical protein IOD12_02025 [Silvanigrellales bacterium]|nr:hypothetical protein [Silvanigrellales bacterium]